MSKVYPVIHVVNANQVESNIAVAVEAGVDGVFLINHHVDVADLKFLLENARMNNPGFWIGANFLGAPLHALPVLAKHAQGLWVDGLPTNPLNLGIPVLGGVAFKYQHTGRSLEEEVSRAAPLVDVLCTSGPATGHAADVDKVKRIKELAPNKPLALASGLTPDNVNTYLPWVDWLLVATGVSSDFTHLDPDKLQSFVSAVRG